MDPKCNRRAIEKKKKEEKGTRERKGETVGGEVMRDEKMKRDERQGYIIFKKEKLRRQSRRGQWVCLEETEAERRGKGLSFVYNTLQRVLGGGLRLPQV